MRPEGRQIGAWHTFAIKTDRIENTTPGSVVRTHAVGYADGTQLHWHAHDWHQLVYASAGVLLVETETGAWIVPPALEESAADQIAELIFGERDNEEDDT